MTPCELIRQTAIRFRSAGIPDPENDSALLLASLSGGSPLSLRLDTDTILEPSLLSRYEHCSKAADATPPPIHSRRSPFLRESFHCGRPCADSPS